MKTIAYKNQTFFIPSYNKSSISAKHYLGWSELNHKTSKHWITALELMLGLFIALGALYIYIR